MMVAEKTAGGRVEKLCARRELDVEALVELRNAARYTAEGRSVLRECSDGLDRTDLPREEKVLRRAAYSWILGPTEETASALRQSSGPLKIFVEGETALDREEFEKAASELSKAAKAFSDSAAARVEVAAALWKAGRSDEALHTLGEINGQGTAEFHHCRGCVYETSGRYDEASADFEKALELDSYHAGAAFRLAFLLDLRGEDDKAVELYRRIVRNAPNFKAAALNLGLALEDQGDTDGAIEALKSVVRLDPTDRRAALHLRNAVESLDMYYDESERKEAERLEAVMRLPLADFELSVRSRNCLAKMNLKVLGDLAHKTEQELMTFKNFGETSLREIRSLLESKGLRLGMNRDDLQRRAHGRPARAIANENPNVNKPIADMELSIRARKCLQRLNIETIGELCETAEAELLAAKNFGQTSLNEIKKKLTEMNLSLKTVS